MAVSFVPRAVFPHLDSLPRSYFLGHHASGLSKMKTMLSSTDLIIECRDYRVPLSSRNPLFEDSLAGRQRLLIYTKKDLGSEGTVADIQRETMIRQWHKTSQVLFSDHRNKEDIQKVLKFARDYASSHNSLTGSRMMVVGMPNVGKSSIINALRQVGVGRGKASRTGAQPGVTRKIATGVKIVEGAESGEGVYLVDTPGVFIPYVPDAETMLKLALCGSVKDTIIPPTTLADYLLYHINRSAPDLYCRYSLPTNDIMLLLGLVARNIGRLQKGGEPDVEGTALWLIQRWRNGKLGRFVLDEITEDSLDRRRLENEGYGGSMSQAKKSRKAFRREHTKKKHLDAG